MDLSVAFLIAVVLALAAAGGTHIFHMRSAVARAMRAEVAKKYGTRSMRQVLGKTPVDVPSDILSISPRFGVIFEQATYAEQDGYHEVCGIGYGKALEILIKDYAIYLSPSEADRIRRASLAEAISKYVADESIRASTDLARALRNSETHYERTYSNHGIEELKSLIQISMLLIEQSEMKRALDGKVQELREGLKNDRASGGNSKA